MESIRKIHLSQRGMQEWVEKPKYFPSFLFNLIWGIARGCNYRLGLFFSSSSSHMSPGFSSGLETICDHRKRRCCWQMDVPCCVGSRLFNNSHVKSGFPVSACTASGSWGALSTCWGRDNSFCPCWPVMIDVSPWVATEFGKACLEAVKK